ncbi:MAG: HAMP domain-containing histidine kinase [Acidobacteria bacterium]|nr:HAMP domain-containing histidine kinase [Acidobacteriota bacterium]
MSRLPLAIFLGIMLVCGGALVWLGHQVLEQDRTLEAHRAQERLEHTVDHVAATFARKLLELDSTVLLEGIVEIRSGRTGIEPVPPARLLYLPAASPGHGMLSGEFTAGETLEFQRNDPAGAAAVYRTLTHSPDRGVQAGAFMRLGRALRKAGLNQEALRVYGELSRLDPTPVLGIPAGVTAAEGLCSTLEVLGRRAELRQEASRFHGNLINGRWAMLKPVWEFHWNEARRWAEAGPLDEREKDRLSTTRAAEWINEQWQNGMHPGGRRILELEGVRVLVSWKLEDRRLRGTIVGPTALRAAWAEAIEGQDGRAALVDADGRVVLGTMDNKARQAVRTPAATGLPWIVQVSSAGSGPAAVARRRELLLAGFAVLAAVLLAGTFSILRAMGRERAVARLQADFVSAVSHEFRTPLTTLLQLSDMLDKDRIPGAEARREVYRVLLRESERLHRLVESLLDFGRLEAKSYRYRLEAVDASEVIREVVDEFRVEATPGGYHVELGESEGRPVIRADREALGLAVWNLLDNAVKYSPECRTVWVELDREDGRLAIRVKDQGIGIPSGEQKRIFRKFVRGTQPTEKPIKGTGIGLTITRRIVEAHHGEIRLRSEPGQGSTFTILLPLEQTV